MSEDVLFEEELVVDPVAKQELSTVSGPEALTEDQLRGARFRLVKLGAERKVLNGLPCLAVALRAELLAPANGRFTDADVELKLTGPDGARLGDVAPTDVRPNTAVDHEISHGGKITAKPGEIVGQIGASHKMTFTTYTCHVQGIGIGGTQATWRLEEDPNVKRSFGTSNPLFVTFLGDGPFETTVQMRCALRTEGLRGIGESIVEFVLGTTLEPGKKRTVTFDAPSAQEKSSWFSWMAS